MKNSKVLIVLISSLTAAVTLNAASTVTEKTFLRTEPAGCGLMMRLNTASIATYRKPGDPQLRISVTPFYRWSHNKADIGKYFGMNNDATGQIDDFIEVDTDSASALGNSADFIHDYAGTATKLKDKVLLRPQRKAYGARIDMCADLDESGDLQLKIGIPLMRVQTSLNPESIDGSAVAGEVPGMGKTATLLNFLAGNVKNLSTDNKQNPLEKMKAPETYQSKMGFSDAEWSISSILVNKANHQVRLGIIGTLPINKTPEGEFWFEPLLSNGKHVSVGVEFLGHLILFKTKSWNSNLFFDAEYKYFFKGAETRTLLYKNAAGEYSAWPVLTLGGEIGQKGVFPLANVLTKEYDVKPGALMEGAFGINLKRKSVRLTFGYAPMLRLKETIEIPAWDEETYAVSNYSYDTTDDFTTSDAFSLAADGKQEEFRVRKVYTKL
ncbi:hypothetical protein ACFLY6_03115 [Candidatus Dependentiae bacterium]